MMSVHCEEKAHHVVGILSVCVSRRDLTVVIAVGPFGEISGAYTHKASWGCTCMVDKWLYWEGGHGPEQLHFPLSLESQPTPSPPTTLFQVLPQVLPQVQPELSEECRKPPRHAPLPGGFGERMFPSVPPQPNPTYESGRKRSGGYDPTWTVHLCSAVGLWAGCQLGAGQLRLNFCWLPREASLESHLRRC